MKVFITGGTGFLGLRLCERLAQSGHDVVALVRPGPPRDALTANVRRTEGDVTDLESLVKGSAGCEAIIHSAALVKMWVPDRNTFDRVNVGGLSNILESARRVGAKKIIYTSSFIGLGPTDGRVADESQVHAPTGHHNDYERTKAAADLLARAGAARGAPLVTLYPGVVYGAGALTDGSLMTRTIRDFMNRRIPGYLGSGEQRICYAFMDDVVEGHLLALERAPLGARYILGGENVTYRELYSLLSQLTGVRAPRRHLPFWLMGLMGRALRYQARLTGREPFITDEVIEIYRHDWAYSSARAVAELGYRITPLAEGLRRTVDWLAAKAT
jgi:farnesol dehydrogenase